MIGGFFGCVGEIERIADVDAAALERFRAHGTVVGVWKRRAMGGQDMEAEEEEG